MSVLPRHPMSPPLLSPNTHHLRVISNQLRLTQTDRIPRAAHVLVGIPRAGADGPHVPVRLRFRQVEPHVQFNRPGQWFPVVSVLVAPSVDGLEDRLSPRDKGRGMNHPARPYTSHAALGFRYP